MFDVPIKMLVSSVVFCLLQLFGNCAYTLISREVFRLWIVRNFMTVRALVKGRHLPFFSRVMSFYDLIPANDLFKAATLSRVH